MAIGNVVIVSVGNPLSATTGTEIYPQVIVRNNGTEPVWVGVAWEGDDISELDPSSNSCTLLGVGSSLHNQETLYPTDAKIMPSVTTTFKINLVGLDSTGEYWVKSSINKSFTITNSGGGGGGTVYTCPICTAVFTTQAALNAHTVDVHESTSFTCGICSAEFATQALLTAHIAAVHGIEEPNFFSRYWKWIVGGGVALIGIVAVGMAAKKKK